MSSGSKRGKVSEAKEPKAAKEAKATNNAGEPVTDGESPARQKRLRPAQCRAYMRRTLAHEFHGIVEGFIKGAKSGSCPHVKLATELLEPPPRKKRVRSGRRTLERWVREMEGGV